MYIVGRILQAWMRLHRKQNSIDVERRDRLWGISYTDAYNFAVGLICFSVSQPHFSRRFPRFLPANSRLSHILWPADWYENLSGMITRPAPPTFVARRNAISHPYDYPVEKS